MHFSRGCAPAGAHDRRIAIRVLIRRLSGPLLMALVLAPVSHAAETVRYSGVVLGVDREAGTIILGELREWWTVRGLEVIRRPIVVELATVSVRVRRPRAPGRDRGEWTEEPLDPGGLHEGDAVMVDCVYEGSRVVATTITLLDEGRP